eukprot:scaffold17439_cov43-Phaeocystis_antarctica.AAC.3
MDSEPAGPDRLQHRLSTFTMDAHWLNAWRPAAATTDSSSCSASRCSSGSSTSSHPRGSEPAAGAGRGSAPSSLKMKKARSQSMCKGNGTTAPLGGATGGLQQ